MVLEDGPGQANLRMDRANKRDRAEFGHGHIPGGRQVWPAITSLPGDKEFVGCGKNRKAAISAFTRSELIMLVMGEAVIMNVPYCRFF
jgi:hypothetical protein